MPRAEHVNEILLPGPTTSSVLFVITTGGQTYVFGPLHWQSGPGLATSEHGEGISGCSCV